MATEQSQNKVTRRVIIPPASPPVIGPYSPGILVNNMLFISGQVGGDAANEGQLVSGGVEKETEQTLINMGIILRAAGADYKNVVKATVFLADMKEFQAMNQVYARFFGENFPARSAFQVVALPKNARVEIEAIAVLGDIQSTH